MFLSDRFAYLELHKTGCTHIRHILDDLFDGESVGSHNLATHEMFTGKRVFLGSIRDPWEWYLSLWAFGCDKKGAVFSETHNSENSGKWRVLYENVKDADAFRTWLYTMNDETYLADIGEGYGNYTISQFAGLMTYRYLRLFCTRRGSMENIERLSTFEQIKNYDADHCFIDHFIRNETLEADLFCWLETYGVQISGNIKSEILSRPRSNASPARPGAEYYYDIGSENLVARREQLIVEKFEYVAPSVK